MERELFKYRFGKTLELIPSCFAIGTYPEPHIWCQTANIETFNCMISNPGSYFRVFNYFYIDLDDRSIEFWREHQSLCAPPP